MPGCRPQSRITGMSALRMPLRIRSRTVLSLGLGCLAGPTVQLDCRLLKKVSGTLRQHRILEAFGASKVPDTFFNGLLTVPCHQSGVSGFRAPYDGQAVRGRQPEFPRLCDNGNGCRGRGSATSIFGKESLDWPGTNDNAGSNGRFVRRSAKQKALCFFRIAAVLLICRSRNVARLTHSGGSSRTACVWQLSTIAPLN